jgi:hypothetical protein
MHGPRRHAGKIPKAQAALIGANVRVLRQRNGWPQTAFGELMGVADGNASSPRMKPSSWPASGAAVRSIRWAHFVSRS